MWDRLGNVVFQSLLLAVYYTILIVDWKRPGEWPADRKLLVVGVLSAQNNFLRRRVVRDTWRTLLDGDIVFIVGSVVCAVPTADRATQQTCDEWTPRLTADNTTVDSNVRIATGNDSHLPLAGYTFIVKQNLTLVELWLCGGALSSSSRLARVLLYDSHSGQIAASATFGYDPLRPALADGVLRKPTVPLRLSDSFEGEIRVLGGRSGGCPLVIASTSPIHLFEGVDEGGQYVELPPSAHVSVGFSYRLAEPDYWLRVDKKRPTRRRVWDCRRRRLQRKLEAEQSQHGDVLFVNVTDVYETLSMKTLAFLNWTLTRQYDFVLKTDDDVFLDVIAVQRELRRAELTTWDWWSCFRVGWPAPIAGKWRNRFWPAERAYPTFPSGAGYVVRSSSLRTMLSTTPNYVSKAVRAAGEDVLVGHLASGHMFESFRSSTCHWACEEGGGYQNGRCNVIELTTRQLEAAWSSYCACQQISGCNKMSEKDRK